MQKIVLLDRDGTIIREPAGERVTSEDEIELFNDTISALKKLADAGYEAIIVTNQAGIGEGRITVEEFERIHTEVLRQLAPSGLKILRTYMCPHTENNNCECRKPKPKMIFQAAGEFNIDLSNTYIIGDRQSDILAARNAGVKGILIKSVHYDQNQIVEAAYITNNLTEAVNDILKPTSTS